MESATSPGATGRPVPVVIRAFASGLFSGYSPFISGTVGSLVGLGIYLIPGFERPEILIPVVVIAFILGIPASRRMEMRYGHDPAEVTIDEVVGMWITLAFLPKTFFYIAAGFFLFRILDIIKPFPARRIDRLEGGLGIMLDDAVVAIYANLVLQVVRAVI